MCAALLALGLATTACGGSGDTFRRDVAVYLGCDEDDVLGPHGAPCRR